jgi:hypothetical protein
MERQVTDPHSPAAQIVDRFNAALSRAVEHHCAPSWRAAMADFPRAFAQEMWRSGVILEVWHADRASVPFVEARVRSSIDQRDGERYFVILADKTESEGTVIRPGFGAEAAIRAEFSGVQFPE